MIFLKCRLAEWVAILQTEIVATVVMCRVRNPACTSSSALGKERYRNGWQEAPLTLDKWTAVNIINFSEKMLFYKMVNIL